MKIYCNRNNDSALLDRVYHDKDSWIKVQCWVQAFTPDIEDKLDYYVQTNETYFFKFKSDYYIRILDKYENDFYLGNIIGADVIDSQDFFYNFSDDAQRHHFIYDLLLGKKFLIKLVHVCKPLEIINTSELIELCNTPPLHQSW